MNTRRSLSIALVACLLTGCGTLAVATAPEKVPSTHRSDLALSADTLFWTTLHGGRYDDIDKALEMLTAAYLADPGDAPTAAHIGWLHIWRLAERSRLDKVPARITDDAALARKYFSEAVRLAPDDARYLGFQAASLLTEADIHKDEKLTREGYYLMLDAVRGWPEFNLFTAGYVMSNLPVASARFGEAVEWQWQAVDACFGEKVDRKRIDIAPYLQQETKVGPKRACWNSWIAPHNFEGFFLNMGDMLVKAGDWQTAQKIYAVARLSSTYEQWKYRDVLEHRIVDAQGNVEAFRITRLDDATKDRMRHTMMFSSAISCMACHE